MDRPETVDEPMRRALDLVRLHGRPDQYCRQYGLTSNELVHQLRRLALYYGTRHRHRQVHQAWLHRDLTVSPGFDERVRGRFPLTKTEIMMVHATACCDNRQEASDRVRRSPDTIKSTLQNVRLKLGIRESSRPVIINAMWDYGYLPFDPETSTR